MKLNKNVQDIPLMPLKDDPLTLRVLGDSKTPSQWAYIAQDAEKDERWGDAYHYWKAGCSEYTRNVSKGQEMMEKAKKCLQKWENLKK